MYSIEEYNNKSQLEFLRLELAKLLDTKIPFTKTKKKQLFTEIEYLRLLIKTIQEKNENKEELYKD